MFDGVCVSLRDFRKVCNMIQDRLYGKATGNCLVACKLGGVSGNHQDGVYGIIQVDGDLAITAACFCTLGEGRVK